MKTRYRVFKTTNNKGFMLQEKKSFYEWWPCGEKWHTIGFYDSIEEIMFSLFGYGNWWPLYIKD